MDPLPIGATSNGCTVVKGFPDLPPIWWLFSIAVIYAAEWLVPQFHVQSSFLDVASWILLFSALATIAWSAIWFWQKRTPIEPNHTPKSLIVEGPYRFSRNPIYLALVLLTVASAVGHGSLIGIFCAFGLWWVLDRRFAAQEEVLLIQTFGGEAEIYLGATRRWI